MVEVLQKPDIRDDELHLNECSIKMQYIVQVCRKEKEEVDARENAANEGLGPQKDFEREHQNQPHFRPTRRRINSDEESVYLPTSRPTTWGRGLEFSMENKWEPLSICALHVPQ